MINVSIPWFNREQCPAFIWAACKKILKVNGIMALLVPADAPHAWGWAGRALSTTTMDGHPRLMLQQSEAVPELCFIGRGVDT